MQKGRRDLSLIRESGSTARVLNLPMIFTSFGTTEEYIARPLFRNKRLNKSLILKHTIRASERDLINKRGTTATKLVLPFAAEDLALGGSSFFVGQKDFEKLLRNSVGGYNEEADLQHDIEVLNIIDELPSFDPFLLRERLKRYGHDPARCYFALSEADSGKMRSFVEHEISRLVELAFASTGGSAGSLSARLAEKLMTDETAQSLEPLRATLQLSGDDYREGVFAWKGFLYYNWRIKDFAPKMADLARQILSVKIPMATSDERHQLGVARQRIVDHLGQASSRVRDGLKSYSDAYGELANGKPTAFRDFLLRAPALFLSVGEALSMLMHIESFWRFRFPAGRALTLPPDEAVEIFGEFEATLGANEAL
jgi:hypothetical protein